MFPLNRHVHYALTTIDKAVQHTLDVTDPVTPLHARNGAVCCFLIVAGPPIEELKLMLLLRCAAAARFAIGPWRPRGLAMVVSVCPGHIVEMEIDQ